MKRYQQAACLLACGLPLAAAGCREGMNSSTPARPSIPSPAANQSLTPQRFADEAGAFNTFMMRAAEEALERSDDSTETSFAKDDIDAHTTIRQTLADAAKAAGVTAPVEVDAQQARLLKSLDAKRGRAFVLAYHDATLKEHRRAIDLFTRATQSLPDGPLKSFASNTLPTLQQHVSELMTHHHGG